MPSETAFVPVPACMVIRKADQLRVISAFSPLDRIGYGHHQILATRAAEVAAKSPVVLGSDVRSAIGRFFIVHSAAEEPETDAIQELAKGQQSKFFRDLLSVVVELHEAKGTFQLSGGFGQENLRGCGLSLPGI